MEHADPNMITLAGGQTGEAGKIDFACLQPGHYDAGMKGKVAVKKGSEKVTNHDADAGHQH
jgi:uncharacterized cupredoxin-like copper-binding protein